MYILGLAFGSKVFQRFGEDNNTEQPTATKEKQVNYRRFQISLDTEAIKKIPDRDIKEFHIGNADTLHGLTNDDMKRITMDDVTKFGLMKTIGEAMTEYIMKSNKFTSDLNKTPTKRDELVTAFNTCIPYMQQELKKPEWIDNVMS